MPEQRRDRVARAVDHGSTAVAGSVGAALGGAKLRDAYKEDYGTKHLTAVTGHAERVAPKARKLTRVLSEGNPAKFKYLAAGSTAAVAAAGASHYREHRKKLLAKSGTVSAEAKKLKAESNRGQGILARTDVVDNSIRRARLKLVPSQTKVALQVADTTRDQVQQQLRKVYDPDARRKRALQTGSAAAAVGSGVSARSAVGEARGAHGHWEGSQKAYERSDRAFSAATEHEKTIDAQRRGMMRPVGSPGNVGGSMRARVGEMDAMEQARRLRHHEGVHQFAAGNREGALARQGLRRVRNKTALAAGLAVTAVGAHRSAHKHDYR